MEITAKELMEMNPEELLIIDIRNEYDRNYGLIPGSVWADAQELGLNPPEDRSKKIILYCARGIISVDLAQALCDQGYEAYSLQEGYLGWLRYDMQNQQEDELCRKVEHSLQKKFRTSLMSPFIKALKDYELGFEYLQAYQHLPKISTNPKICRQYALAAFQQTSIPVTVENYKEIGQQCMQIAAFMKMYLNSFGE